MTQIKIKWIGRHLSLGLTPAGKNKLPILLIQCLNSIPHHKPYVLNPWNCLVSYETENCYWHGCTLMHRIGWLTEFSFTTCITLSIYLYVSVKLFESLIANMFIWEGMLARGLNEILWGQLKPRGLVFIHHSAPGSLLTHHYTKKKFSPCPGLWRNFRRDSDWS